MAKLPPAVQDGDTETLPFKIHPRAFKSLGADLVTNDVVAIIELVKNAYDAYATVVEVRFINADNGWILEIEDNGSGMSRATIADAWCTVATPYREDHPVAKRRGMRNRRVSGEKGLGRLSAARLGMKLEMITQIIGGDCWTVRVDWDQLARFKSLDQCVVSIRRTEEPPFDRSGTLLRIFPLRTKWNDQTWSDLRANLSRLIAPFAGQTGFAIRLSTPSLVDSPIDIESPLFLNHPKYIINGTVEPSGLVKWKYKYAAIRGGGHRRSTGQVTWSQVKEQAGHTTLDSMKEPNFGPFTFDLRAWDTASHDTAEISERFHLKKSSVKHDIKAYKGISVYRDDVLVLPKSEGTRDWLGLDVRRIGKVGQRLSTTQMVGYIAISAANNPDIVDTSDREGLVATPIVLAFESTLRTIVRVMENERTKDRQTTKEHVVADLFKQLSAEDLVSNIAEVASEDGSASDTLPIVHAFSKQLDKAREEIESAFMYYSRLATVGTIAHMLIHEIRNRTTVLGHVLDWLGRQIGKSPEDRAATAKLEEGHTAVAALDNLADIFSPLANRQFKRRKRSAYIEASILRCLLMLKGDLKAGKISVSTPTTTMTEVAVDPGELDAVLLNIIGNAIYWLSHKGGSERNIEIRVRPISGCKRISVEVHDSGPGITEEDAERVFWPGVTNKPGGIGMGLTVASELIAEYEGRLALDRSGKLFFGGATFIFDLPLK